MYDLHGNAVSGYSKNGTAISPCYDINGNVLSGHSQLFVVKFLNFDTWAVHCNTAYNLMKTEFDNTPNSIPFFISTDQHGRNISANRYVHNIDTTELANINLGDCVGDYFNYTELNNLESYANGIANYIAVAGNHDAFTRGSDVANNADIIHYFSTSMEKVVPEGAEVAYYKALDRERNVKYLVLCPYYIPEDGMRTYASVETAQMQWLIDELTANDGFDSVILMHQLWTDLCMHRDGTMQGWADAPIVLENMWIMLKDRRNGRSGTVTDSLGVEHTYDFTNCQTRLLCSFHGHTHEELYQTDENMTQYAADWLGAYYTCVFGLIDRDNNKLKIWEFSTNGVKDVFEMNI